tara:strand:+ start:848 stop:991 length:144 start_codon:yes stop_codon:yes gene_type:complete
MNKQLIALRLEPEMIEAIKKQAKVEERNMSNLIRLAVKKYLESVKQD